MPAVIDLLRAAGVECYTREQWGSPRERDGSYARRRGTHPMPAGPAAFHFLHITVTPDTDLPADGMEAARKVELYGLSTPPMVSYQDLVTNEGRYFEGQSYGVKGTHTVNDKGVPGFEHDLNRYGYATALMQNVGDDVTDAQVRLVAMIFAARELVGLVRRGAPIYPHRAFDWKACPGDKAVARLDEIHRLRDEFVRNGLPNQEDDMPYSDWPEKDREALANDVKNAILSASVGEDRTVRTALRMAAKAPSAGRTIERLIADRIVAASPVGAVDPTVIEEAVKAALREGTGE